MLQVVQQMAEEVVQVVNKGVQLGIVVGGGNYFRGAQAEQELRLDRATADYVGMLATIMNCLVL